MKKAVISATSEYFPLLVLGAGAAGEEETTLRKALFCIYLLIAK